MTFPLILSQRLHFQKLSIFNGGNLHIDERANNNNDNKTSPLSLFLVSLKPKCLFTCLIVNDKGKVTS